MLVDTRERRDCLKMSVRSGLCLSRLRSLSQLGNGLHRQGWHCCACGPCGQITLPSKKVVRVFTQCFTKGETGSGGNNPAHARGWPQPSGLLVAQDINPEQSYQEDKHSRYPDQEFRQPQELLPLLSEVKQEHRTKWQCCIGLRLQQKLCVEHIGYPFCTPPVSRSISRSSNRGSTACTFLPAFSFQCTCLFFFNAIAEKENSL